MNRVVSVVFVLALPTAVFGQVVGDVHGGRYVGRVVVLGAVVELPALDPPAPRRSAPCRPRPSPFTRMLVAHTGLQLMGHAVGTAGLRGQGGSGRPDVVGRGLDCLPLSANGVLDRRRLHAVTAGVVIHNYRLGSELLAR